MELPRLLRRTREILRDEGPAALEQRARRRLAGDQRLVFEDYAAWRRLAPAGPRCTAPPKGPPISVVVPIHDPPPRALFELVRSLREQHYRTWDAVLVDDGSRDPEVRRLLAEAARDPRIQLLRHDQPQGIGAATAAGLRQAGQELIAFVDHDDALDPEALGLVAEAFAADARIDLLYTDEDKLDAWGAHDAPWFKPAWDPLLLWSWNYVGHLTVVRRRALDAAGGFAPAVDGAQDYDLVLRLAEQVRHVAHLPQVLYHWRALPGSAADSPAAKPAAHEAARRALEDARVRRGIPGRIEPGLLQGTFRLIPEPRWSPREVAALVLDDRPPAWLEVAGVEQVFTLSREADPALVDAIAERTRCPALLLLGAGATPRAEPRAALDALLGWLQPGLARLVTPQLVHAGRVVEQGLVLGRLPGGRAGPFEAVAPGEPGYFGLALAPRSMAAASGQCLLVDAAVWHAHGGLRGSAGSALTAGSVAAGPAGAHVTSPGALREGAPPLTSGTPRDGAHHAGTPPRDGAQLATRAAALCLRAGAHGARLVGLPEPWDVETPWAPLTLEGSDPFHSPQFRPDPRLRLAPQARGSSRIRSG